MRLIQRILGKKEPKLSNFEEIISQIAIPIQTISKFGYFLFEMISNVATSGNWGKKKKKKNPLKWCIWM